MGLSQLPAHLRPTDRRRARRRDAGGGDRQRHAARAASRDGVAGGASRGGRRGPTRGSGAGRRRRRRPLPRAAGAVGAATGRDQPWPPTDEIDSRDRAGPGRVAPAGARRPCRAGLEGSNAWLSSLTLERPTRLDALELAVLADWLRGSLARRICCAGRSTLRPRARHRYQLPGRRDGAARHGVADRPRIRVITVDSGRLRQETYDLIDQVRERYQIPIEVFSPEAPRSWRRSSASTASNPSTAAWSCGVPLLRDPQGHAADAGARRARRLGLRAAAGPLGDAAATIRVVERDARARRDREAQSPGRLERRRRSGTTCAPTTCPTTPSTTRDSPASAARPAPARPRPATIRAPAAGGGKATRRRSAASTAASIGTRCGRESGEAEVETSRRDRT